MKTISTTLALSLALATGSAFAQNANVPNEAPDFASCSALRPNRYEPGPSGAGERRPDRAGAAVSTDLSAQPTTPWCDAYYVQVGQRRNLPNVVLARPGDQVLIQRPVETPAAQPTVRTVTYDRTARRNAAEAMGVATDARDRATAALAGLAQFTQRTSAMMTEMRQGLANEAQARATADAALRQADEAEAAAREAADGAIIAQLRQQAALLRQMATELAAMRAERSATPDAHGELALTGGGLLNTAGAVGLGGGWLTGAVVLQFDSAALRFGGGYGTVDQGYTPGAGYKHAGLAFIDGLFGVGRLQGIAGLGGHVVSSDAAGGLGWSIFGRGGLGILLTDVPAADRRPTGFQMRFELVGTAGFMVTHGVINGQPAHGGGLGLGFLAAFVARI